MAPRSTLYFHAPCFDGVVSAILLVDYLEGTGIGAVERYLPVDYSVKGAWLNTALPAQAVIVDFLYHPEAWFWFDHHATTFASQRAQEIFQARPTPHHVYDPAADSCSGLIWRHLASVGYRNTAFEQLVGWAEKTDAARYTSVEEAVESRAPALQIHASLGVDADPEFCTWLVQTLRTQPVEEVAALPDVARRYARFREQTAEGLRRFERGSKLDPGEIVVFDVDTAGSNVSRYAPYVLYPRARYSIGILRSSRGAKISAMRNPWREFPSVHLGRIFERKGGGGHARVGSLYLEGSRVDLAHETLKQLLEEIRSGSIDG